MGFATAGLATYIETLDVIHSGSIDLFSRNIYVY